MNSSEALAGGSTNRARFWEASLAGHEKVVETGSQMTLSSTLSPRKTRFEAI